MPCPLGWYSLLLADVGQRAVEGDAVRGHQVEAVDAEQGLHARQHVRGDLHGSAIPALVGQRRELVLVHQLCDRKVVAVTLQPCNRAAALEEEFYEIYVQIREIYIRFM